MLMINDLLRHNQGVMGELSVAAMDALKSGWYILGNQVKEFEREFASYCQAEHCVSVANSNASVPLATETQCSA